MLGQTKMIIITTDEDIIRQFSSNKSTSTQIIHLDDNSEEILPKKNVTNDIVNLPFLAELSKLNSSNDQIYKRALDSTGTVSSKPIKTPRRSIDMICAICGGKAIGYNYNVLSCGSCKAFFHRNANKNLESLRCLTREGQCSIAHDVHRKCPKCRLERCFAVGMRIDFMQSAEEKQRKKNILEQNRNMASADVSLPVSNPEDFALGSDELNRLLNNTNGDNDNNIFDEHIHLNLSDDILSVEDWITIEHVQFAFLSVLGNDAIQHFSHDCEDPISAIISWSHIVNNIALNVIKFFRQINEFEELDANDRFILIKYNLFPLYPILKCFYINRKHGSSTVESDDEIAQRRRFLVLCFGSDHAQQTFTNIIFLLLKTIQQDETILSLLLVVLMFSQGLSMNEDEPLLKDALQVNRAQSHYVQLLWNYMIHKWGDIEAHKCFTRLLSIIFQMQKTSKMLCNYFQIQMIASNAADQLAPLMQTVLHIS